MILGSVLMYGAGDYFFWTLGEVRIMGYGFGFRAIAFESIDFIFTSLRTVHMQLLMPFLNWNTTLSALF